MRLRPNSYAVPAIVFFCVSAYTFSKFSTVAWVSDNVSPQQSDLLDDDPIHLTPPIAWEDLPVGPDGPMLQPASGASTHPISYLIDKARKEFEDTRKRQSKTLQEAVKEYRRRYGMPPPPHFDRWFELATRKGVQLVDEFDTIHDLIAPFWGLQPKTIRSRAREALGFDNGLIGIAIRDHEVTLVENGPEWQQESTHAMMKNFLKYLPDMDLAFNIHDEPRVVVPHDDLARLIHKAKVEAMALNANTGLVNEFSSRAPDLNDGKSFDDSQVTRFTPMHHQRSWSHSRLSCPPDSPSRALDDDEATDALSKYAMGELGFIYNTTAMADICLTPTLGLSYGFFERPNFQNVAQELFPIFSQSKISSYGDILYPSPWYWADKVSYVANEDRSWVEKQGSLYWRGSTTGGFSRDGGWRRQHRQHFVQKMDSKSQAKIMVNDTDEADAVSSAPWRTKEVSRGTYSHLFDVKFSLIDQCDPGDCEAQEQVFQIVDRAEQSDAWKYKYLLDMDGNAFSGRFYAFLQSHSLTFKFAIFREWHAEWLKPWVHFVPMSLRGDEWLEAVRYFDGNETQRGATGTSQGEKIAEESREWANKVVRKDDMEVWFFRLLLEYARVIDDNRANLGFDPE